MGLPIKQTFLNNSREGTIRVLRKAGFADITAVQNKTVVTDAFKGEDLNRYVPIFKEYGIPVLFNFRPEEMTCSSSDRYFVARSAG